jgi:hypothetical protein
MLWAAISPWQASLRVRPCHEQPTRWLMWHGVRQECTPALIKIAKDAGQVVPDFLLKHGKSKASKLWKVEKAVLPPAE